MTVSFSSRIIPRNLLSCFIFILVIIVILIHFFRCYLFYVPFLSLFLFVLCCCCCSSSSLFSFCYSSLCCRFCFSFFSFFFYLCVLLVHALVCFIYCCSFPRVFLLLLLITSPFSHLSLLSYSFYLFIHSSCFSYEKKKKIRKENKSVLSL